jgi:hypothetical protein
MGFKEAKATEEAAGREEVPIPSMAAKIQADMNEAAMNVDDTIKEEPMYEWDRDNPDMSVGICYPNMDEFRLAIRQHAIVKEFELGTEHSDKERFRGCAALGCPWKIRARTQHDGSVRVYFYNVLLLLISFSLVALLSALFCLFCCFVFSKCRYR